MITKIYKGIQPGIIFLILITGIVFWINAILEPEEVTFPFDKQFQPLYHLITPYIKSYSILSVISGFIFVFVTGILLVRLNRTYFFINQRSYLPVLFFILGSSVFISLQNLNPVLIAVMFLIITLDRVFSTYKVSKTSFRYFDAGILIGLGSLFYFNLAFYLVIIWIALIILRTFNWREWMVTILGFLTPWIFTLAIHFLIYGEVANFFVNIESGIVESFHFEGFTLGHLLFFSFLGLIILVLSAHMIYAFTGKKISSRKYLKIMLWIFILTLLIYFIVPSASVELIFILFVPLSYLFTHFFVSIRTSWIGDILFVLFLGSVAVAQFL